MKSDKIFMYQIVEEKHEYTNEPNDDITTHSEYVHRTYKQAIDELYSMGYRYKNTEQTSGYTEPIEYFYKETHKERMKEENKYNPTYKAYIKTLTLMKNELKKEQK